MLCLSALTSSVPSVPTSPDLDNDNVSFRRAFTLTSTCFYKKCKPVKTGIKKKRGIYIHNSDYLPLSPQMQTPDTDFG